MTIGAGMWTLGVLSTLVLLGFQYFFHKNLRMFKDVNTGHILLHIRKDVDAEVPPAADRRPHFDEHPDFGHPP